jgi:hypothetical protein
MADNDQSKWRLVDPNWRIPVHESEILAPPTPPDKVPFMVAFIKMLWGFLTLVSLSAFGILGIAYLLELEQVGYRDALGISVILIFLRALDKTTFGKVS